MSDDETTPGAGAKIGATIRRLRHQANMTLEQLSERAGLTPHFIGSIELGQRDPSISSLEAIAGALGVTIGSLLGESPPHSELAIEMGRMFDKVPEPHQQGILKLLRATKGKPRR